MSTQRRLNEVTRLVQDLTEEVSGLPYQSGPRRHRDRGRRRCAELGSNGSGRCRSLRAM
jgi:hypothetical protein